MTEDDIDAFDMVELHKLAERAGEGIAPGLYERMLDLRARAVEDEKVVRLPQLHEREDAKLRGYPLWHARSLDENNVIAFPLVAWQRNALRREGRK